MDIILSQAFDDFNKRVLEATEKVQQLRIEIDNTPWWNIKRKYYLKKEWEKMNKVSDNLGEELNALHKGLIL